MRIVAIGGGEINLDGVDETAGINKFILSLSPKKSPRVGFIGYASGDNIGYFKSVKKAFKDLGAEEVIHINLSVEYLNIDSVIRQLKSIDCLYVGGGNTIRLVNKIKQLKLNKVLEDLSSKNNLILSGLSAGANVWFESCSSDSEEVTSEKDPLGLVECLGLIQGMCSPHHIREADTRNKYFKKLLDESNQQRAVLIDDKAAYVYIDGEEYFVSEDDSNRFSARVYRNGESKELNRIKIA